MDAELVRNYLMGINILLTVGFWWATSRENKDKATVASIDRVEKTLTEKIEIQEGRLTRAEQDIHHKPTHDDLGKIYDKLNEVNGNLKELSGEFKHVSNNLDRLYQNELDKKS